MITFFRTAGVDVQIPTAISRSDAQRVKGQKVTSARWRCRAEEAAVVHASAGQGRGLNATLSRRQRRPPVRLIVQPFTPCHSLRPPLSAGDGCRAPMWPPHLTWASSALRTATTSHATRSHLRSPSLSPALCPRSQDSAIGVSVDAVSADLIAITAPHCPHPRGYLTPPSQPVLRSAMSIPTIAVAQAQEDHARREQKRLLQQRQQRTAAGAGRSDCSGEQHQRARVKVYAAEVVALLQREEEEKQVHRIPRECHALQPRAPLLLSQHLTDAVSLPLSGCRVRRAKPC